MNTSLRRRATAAFAILVAVSLAGCAASADDPIDSEAATPSASTAPSGDLTVFAAASLSQAFDELAAQFEREYPDVDVQPISYDGSSVLATQLIEGAEVDVFASADEKNMAKVTDAGLAGEGSPFATNVLEIAVAPGNPDAIEGLADLTASGLTVVVCAPEVPCGNAAATLLDLDGVALTPASEEQNVTAVLAKVKSGEADAGLVYRTDITAAGDAVTGVEIDGSDRATNVYPLVALDQAPNPLAAQAFVDFVLSDAGQKVLADFGFGAP